MCRSSYSFLFTRFCVLSAFHTGKLGRLVFCETVFFDGVADLLLWGRLGQGHGQFASLAPAGGPVFFSIIQRAPKNVKTIKIYVK